MPLPVLYWKDRMEDRESAPSPTLRPALTLASTDIESRGSGAPDTEELPGWIQVRASLIAAGGSRDI